MQRAIEKSECCICFEPLCSQPCAMLFRQHRVCLHYFHDECLENLRNQTCPICRSPYDRTVRLVDPIDEPEVWFDMIDKDGSGSLSYQEVLEGLKATVDMDWRKLEADTAFLFNRWDAAGTGEISLDEFRSGLLVYIERRHGANLEEEVVPHIRNDPCGWFRYWDADGNNCLQKDEVARAIVKTLRLQETGMRTSVSIDSVLETVNAVWCLFDHDNSDGIDIDEFTAPDGLCDTILASMAVLPRK